MKQTLATVVLAVSVAWVPVVAEQPGFAVRPLEPAIAEAAGQQKLLVVICSTNKTTQRVNEQVWSNPAVASWVRRHALGVCVTDAATFQSLSKAGLAPLQGAGFKADPLLYKTGNVLRLFGSNGPQSRFQPPAGGPSPASIAMALRLDWTLRGFTSTDAGWYAAHVAAIGPATPPPVRALAGMAETEIAAFADPAAGPDGKTDVAAVWKAARAAAKAGDLKSAIGAYTWLWEQATRRDPAFDAAAVFVLPAEMATLAQQSPAAKKRFAALREAMLPAFDGADLPGVCHYLMIGRAVGDHVENFDFIDSALNDQDALLMMPAADRLAWNLALPRLHTADLLSMTRTPNAWLDRLAQRLASGPTKRTPAEQWDRFAAFARWLGARDGCRIYATLLVAGRADEARAAAERTLEIAPGAETRRMLAATAILAGHGGAVPAGWLTEGDPLRAYTK